MMSLVMPDELLWMRHDVPPRPWDGHDWAAGLEVLRLPASAAFYARFAPAGRAGTAVRDWVPLHERMRYILALFRARQDEPWSRCGPYTPDQTARIWGGALPDEQSLCLPYNVTRCCVAARGAEPKEQEVLQAHPHHRPVDDDDQHGVAPPLGAEEPMERDSV